MISEDFKAFRLWHSRDMHVYLNRNHVAAIRGPLGHQPSAMEIEMATRTIHIVQSTEEDIQAWLAL